MVRYSTALSHLILAGTGFFCFLKSLSGYTLPFAKVSFGIIVLDSLLRLWRWGNPTYGRKIYRIYRLTTNIHDLLVLPNIVTTIWLKYDFSIAHTAVSLLPLMMYIYDNRNNDVFEIFLTGNIISCCLFSYFYEDYYDWLCNFFVELACVHVAVTLFLMMMCLNDNRKKMLIDKFLIGNIISLVLVSYFNDNYYGLITTLLYAYTHFCIKRRVIVDTSVEVPTQDLFNYYMCFFTFFSLKAME